MALLTFRELVDRVRRKRKTKTTIADMAGELGVARGHLYDLMKGAKSARVSMVDRLTRGLGVSRLDVVSALETSRMRHDVAAATKRVAGRARRRSKRRKAAS